MREGEALGVAKAVSPSRALPLLATPLFCVVVGVNVLTGCGFGGVEEGRLCRSVGWWIIIKGSVKGEILQIVLPFSDPFFVSNCRLPHKHCIVPSDVPALHRSCTGHKIPAHSK